MGPPETPSRFMQQSPNLFPSLQFSPDLYANQYNPGPATAPIYPQQRLFWDPNPMSFEEQHLPQQYQDPFQMSPVGINTSFASSSTIVPSFPQQEILLEDQPYDLPNIPRSTSFSQVDGSAFPAPFTTSPRIPAPPMENPSMFLSSPARRFGGPDQPFNRFGQPPVPERPAYAHQIEESRREQEMKRMRRTEPKQPSITRSVMEALRRPVSPVKDSRPGLKRSLTHTGARNDRGLRVQTRTGRTSPAPNNISRPHRPGRSSPLKTITDPISRTLSTSRNANIKRGSLSLAIDENGVAKTIVTDNQIDMDLDDALSSATDSFDESDFQILHSQHNSFVFQDTDEMSSFNHPSSLNRRYSHSKSNSRSTMASTSSNKQVGYQSSQSSYANTRASDGTGGRKKRPLMGTSIDNDILMEDQASGNAQSALRAIIQDRSRSTSSQGDNSNHHHLHSSPPLVQNQYATYNASPTTITDPDLATPSTDRDSIASNMSTRCVCKSSLLDGSVPVVQCDSCSKWLHTACVGIDSYRIPEPYICSYCHHTPTTLRQSHGRGRTGDVTQGQSLRASAFPNTASPLAHKSAKRAR